MSIVAVHGPNTFGSAAVAKTGPVLGTVNPANGLIWDFRLDASTTRPDQDFSWAFPPNGTPTPQLLADPAPVTYATAGSKVVTLTVTNTARTVSNKALTSNVATLTTTVTHGFKVGQTVVVAGVDATFNGTYIIASTPSGTTFTYALVAANVGSTASGGTVTSADTQYPAAGSYPITITAVAGVGPQMAAPSEADSQMAAPSEVDSGADSPVFDPFNHTVDEVLAYAENHPDEVEAILAAEESGKNRSTLVNRLDQMRPYDPALYTVQEVEEYASANPDQVQDIIAAEKAGKNRSTLLAYLRGE